MTAPLGAGTSGAELVAAVDHLRRGLRPGSRLTLLGVILSNGNDVLDRFGGAALVQVTATLAERLRDCVVGDLVMATHPGGLVAAIRTGPSDPPITPELVDRGLGGFVGVRRHEVWPVVTSVLRDWTPGEAVPEALATIRGALFDAHDRTPGTSTRSGGAGTGAADRIALVADLATALRSDPTQLDLVYQPVVDLGTGAVLGAEALLRWQHPVRGEVPPSVAVDAAERSGLIHQLGRLVLDRSVAQLGRWRRGGADLTMHVNVSPHQLRHGDFAEHLAATLATHDVPAASVLLELTESSVMGDGAALAELGRLRDVGVLLGLDDFGTGYSSIAHLHLLPVQTVKVDRSLVADIATSGASFDLLRAVVGLLDASDVAVVVEGVETAVQAAHARAVGCRAAQGYLFGRPGPAADFPLPAVVVPTEPTPGVRTVA